MTDTDDALEQISRAAAELVPALTERLAQHGLGEIEVWHGSLHLRVVAGPSAPTPAPVQQAGGAGQPETAQGAVSSAPTVASIGVSSPAVGFFVYADGLGPGQSVTKGEALGHVEMLGVRHDVRAPRSGTVRHLVAETGEAVEYGQVVVELEAAGGGR